MTIPGTPKLGFPGTHAKVSVGSAEMHGGHGYKGGVVDDYPIKFGVLRHRKGESQKKPVNPSIKPAQYYKG